MYRTTTTADQRSESFALTIDPGFVNRRLVQTVVGDIGMQLIDNELSRIPPLPQGLMETRIDHAYTKILLNYTKVNGIKTLGQLIADGKGHLFCSTEQFEPCENFFESERASSAIHLPFDSPYRVTIDYSPRHVKSDTLRLWLNNGESLSVVAMLHRKEGNTLRFRPLVIGFPWLSHEREELQGWGMWHRKEFYEHFVEDFCEFSRVASEPFPDSFEPMREISESAFKHCLVRLLHDQPKKDWGGESSDHFTCNLHLHKLRVTASFLFKGPARFEPMTPAHLGKNGDQIYRLAQEPSQVLFVQHCHEILPSVRATLRAFAVQPLNARRYCLIDGKDSLRLLQAYNLYDEARRLTRQ